VISKGHDVACRRIHGNLFLDPVSVMIWKYIRKLIDRFGPLNRAIGRLSVWRRICSDLRPDTVMDLLGLWLSVVFDSLCFSVMPRSSISPQSCCRLLLRAPRLGVHFSVRKSTDDIYAVLPFREMDVQDAILGRLRPGDVFVDVGANVGYYSVLGARAVGPNGCIVAIEAVPSTAGQLALNLRLNNVTNALIVNKAVQDSTGIKEVEMEVPQGNFGLASSVIVNRCEQVQRLRVEATTIDSICSGYSRIRVMKLDVEGSEHAALLGSGKTLEKVECVVVECTGTETVVSLLLSSSGFLVKKLQFGSHLVALRKESG